MTSSTSSTIWSKLPNEIIGKILGFYYSPQPIVLMEDIRSFYDFHAEASKYYYRYWITVLNSALNEDRNWLLNDLILFLNDYIATMYGYTKNYCSVINRLHGLEKKPILQVIKHIISLYDRPVNIQIKVICGLLTPRERGVFLKNHC